MPNNYHIFLKGEVGSRWSGNFTSDMVNWILDKHKDSEVHVLINSLGGYTHEGLSISSLFKIHGNVHVHFIGQSASAATIAAMGAKKISIDADAMFLVHRCAGIVFEWDVMNAEQIDEFIAKLEKQKQEQSKIDNVVANLYAKRCKKSQEDLLQLMSKDTWLTAKEALEWGFVDEITDDADDKEPLTDSTAAAMSSAGIPLPPGFKGRKGSMLNRFFDFLRSFNHQDSEQEPADDGRAPADDPENSNDMNTESTQSPQQPMSSATAPSEPQTVQQPAAPGAAEQSDKDAEIASLKSQLAERDRTISELRKQPAAPTSAVVESKKDDSDPYAPVSEADGIAASKAFLEKFS
ncbi:MAG: ATP-dependent Clp protease proteolytic subunit [Muribaculaceae bacterium]|nr:ATP-dependent Clp protease proteolytic subunit [Muribaculaceae bacterium]